MLNEGEGWVSCGRWKSSVRRGLSLAEAVVDRLSQHASRETLASTGPGGQGTRESSGESYGALKWPWHFATY